MAAGSMRRVPVPTGTAALALLPALRDALDSTGPALLPLPGDGTADRVLAAARPADPVTEGTALLLPTSGSTGEPKVVELAGEALLASARATHRRLGGAGRWVLALPLGHVAGWQVLVRSVDAGLVPSVLDLAEPFTAAAFAGAVAAAAGPRRYASLVPTQLRRLLDAAEGVEALRALDAVLLGGAAAPAPLLERARAIGVPVVTTYGMTETSGGCVYDGRALDGVSVDVDSDGRVHIAGPVLATGYRGPRELTAEAFPSRGGCRWFATSDVGELRDGRLEVHGRLDDVVVTGGRKVAPVAVESVVAALPGVRQALVVGVPDEEWGQAVVALVVGEPGPLADLRRAVTHRLGAACAPRHLLVVDALPERGIGKPDRAAAAALARRLLGRDG